MHSLFFYEVTALKARSHDAFFSECDSVFLIACNGLCGCQWHCSHGATAMDFCVMSHMNELHTHSL